MSGGRDYQFEEHVGEVRVRLLSPDYPGLFRVAGLALAELMLGDAARTPSTPWEEVTVRAPDREALLVEWLNELIFRSETQKRVYTDFEIREASGEEIRAALRGVDPEQLRTAVKAATFHDVSVRRPRTGYEATVVLDV